MKDPKNVTRNPNLGFYPAIVDKTGNVLIGRFVGTVMEYVPVPNYGLDPRDYETVESEWAAYQLITGEIVMVDTVCGSMEVRSAAGIEKDICFGKYPDGFPEEWKYYV